MSDPDITHFILFTALRKECAAYSITEQLDSQRLTGSGILDLLKRPEAIEVTGGFVVDGPDPIIVLFVSLNAGEVELRRDLASRAQEMLTTARRLKLQTEIAAHRKQIEDLTRQLNELRD